MIRSDGAITDAMVANSGQGEDSNMVANSGQGEDSNENDGDEEGGGKSEGALGLSRLPKYMVCTNEVHVTS